MWTNAYAIAGYAAIAAGILSGLHALLNKRDPRSQLGWLVLCVLVPVAGAFFYWLLGVNRIKTRARRWQQVGRFTIDTQTVNLAHARPERAESMGALLRISRAVTQRPIVAGNKVEVLHNGEEAFPAMLDAIENARDHIHLCTYIFETDRLGRQVADALIAAGERGVMVRVLVDAIGEKYARPRIGRLLRRGHDNVRFARFLPLTFSLRALRVNLRNHRKILAIDGRTGFTGGMNIGGRHLVNDADNRNPTADIHFRVDGPAVSFMEETFAADWYFTTHEEIDWSVADPPLEGTALCRGIVDGPNEDFEKLQLVLLGALSVARERVRIMTPYFIPTRELVSALNSAALRGAEVEIILPRKSNLPFVDWATNHMIWELLQYGARVFYRPPPFAHSKLFIVDDYYIVIGSANLDPRSLRLNFEFNMEIFDSELGGRLVRHFEEIRSQSHELRLEESLRRPLPRKLRDATAKLFAPYL